MDLDRRMSCVVEYIGANLHESPDYRRLARLANLSYSQFFREFKRRTGQSPQHYIEEQRIAYARRLLAAGRLSVKEVAFQCGFQNQLYFSRRFQKAAGMSPSQYRANCLSDPERALHPYAYYMGVITTDRAYGSYA
ncbi:MAG: AraC family transcriptional regulator [Kiritimatiellae bacterium]|nr:AraC family transcriptional regulator [Kiritimatiellia bacterium]